MQQNNESFQSKEFSQKRELFNEATALINLAAGNSNYGKDYRDGVPHQDALQRATEFIANDPDSLKNFKIGERSANLLDLAGRVGGFIEGQDSLNNDNLSPEEARYLRDADMIPFNSLLKDFINLNPSVSMNNLESLITETYRSKFQGLSHRGSSLSVESIHKSAHDIVEGMRHELAAETLLDQQGIKFDYQNQDGSDLADKKGEDLRVYFEEDVLDDIFGGSDWHDDLDPALYKELIRKSGHSLDVKASAFREAKAREQHPYGIIAWTGLHPRDFTGTRGDSSDMLTIPYGTYTDDTNSFLTRVVEGTLSSIEYRYAHKR